MKRISFVLLFALMMFGFIHTSAADDNSSSERIVTPNAGLRLRATPDTNGKIIITIPFKEIVTLLEEKGDPITISGKTGKWSKVKWHDKTGWAFGGFLDTFTNEDIPAAAVMEQQANTIDVKEIYGKQLQSKEAAESGNGQPIEIKFDKNGTYRIMRPQYAGELVVAGKYSIISYGDPVVINLKTSRSKCTDMGQEYKCSIDEGTEITIEKVDGKYHVSANNSIGGKWDKVEFIISK